MMSPVYHPNTQLQIDAVRASLPHALLLEGANGSGLLTAATDIAGTNLADIIAPTNKDGDTDYEKGSVRIGQIRALYESTRGKSRKSRVFIIDDADTMTLPSQHAFLKLLEEPPLHTRFILTAHSPNQLLATVRSRLQRIRIQPLLPNQTRVMIDQQKQLSDRERQQVLYLANGLPAAITRLASTPAELAQKGQLISDARQLLQGNSREKLSIIHGYYSDRQATLALLGAAELILRHSIATAPTSALIARADTLHKVYERVAANGNTRLQLLLIVV